jgi:hypothetical protein
MTYRGSLVYPSTNVKTGPIATITVTRDTCAEDCPFRKHACYADSGPLRIHWDMVTDGRRGEDWDGLCGSVRSLPKGVMIRYGQAGDLPGDGVLIDRVLLLQIAKAAKGRKMFGYSHYPMQLEWNSSCVEMALFHGFVVNVSANTLAHADELKGLVSAPVVAVLPRDYPHGGGFTPGGHRVVVCPAQTRDDVTCQTCRLCASAKRKSIIGFIAHGASARRAEEIARGE